MILRVGLTGGIASGKSTVLRFLRELGCRVTDADAIVAMLYRPGQTGHAALVGTYGESILTPAGEIDRKALAAMAFSSPEESARLNALIHPLVVEEETRIMRDAVDKDAAEDVIHVVEATLLIEAGGRGRYDRIIVVDVDPSVQLTRGEARGMAREDMVRRIAHQLPREERIRHADYVIDNSSDENALQRATERLYQSLQQDLDAKKKSPGFPRG